MLRWLLSVTALLALMVPARLPAHAEELSDADRETIQADVRDIRGLQATSPVLVKRVSQAELRAQLLEEYDDPELLKTLATSKKYNVLLGLVSPDIDLHATLVDTFTGQIIGQYRPTDKTMYLVADETASVGPETRSVLAHEYTHALQDQRFDLEAMTTQAKDHDDRSFALRALFEGDASWVSAIYEQDKLTADEASALNRQRLQSTPTLSVPFILQEELLFPYIEGLYFVIQLWQDGGFGAVDAAYADPPVSTEQIIHPDKFRSHEAPVELGLPDLQAIFGPGWSQTYANVNGELELRILMEQFTDSLMASRAAEGWGGDAFAVLEGPDERVAWMMDSSWDTEADAREFSEVFAFSLERRFGVARQTLVDEPGKSLWSTPVGIVGVTVSGKRLAAVYAPERSQTEAVLAVLSPQSTAPRLPIPTPKPAT